MGWYDIKNKISTPIITSDGITEILKSCLLKDGQNKIHSASIKMDNYKRPEHKEEVDESEVKKIQFNLIRYMAQSLLKDCDLSKPNLYISKIMPGWKEKNPELDITVNELKRIILLSDNQIESILNRNQKVTNIDKFIYKVNTSIDFNKYNGTHMGNNPIYPFRRTQYSKRIYFNTPRNNIATYKFLSLYIKQCIDKRIPFDMKAFGSEEHEIEQLDGTVLYSNNEFFEDHLDIIQKIIKENPELMSSFGTPIYTGGSVKEKNGTCYYSVAAGIPENGSASYNKHIDRVINSAYLISCCKLIKQYFPVIAKEFRELNDETKDIIEKLNKLNEYSPLEILNSTIKLSKETKKNIRQLGYRIITFKQQSSSQKESEEIMDKLKTSFLSNFKLMSSLLKFRDKNHTETPIYQDADFIEYDRNHKERQEV